MKSSVITVCYYPTAPTSRKLGLECVDTTNSEPKVIMQRRKYALQEYDAVYATALFLFVPYESILCLLRIGSPPTAHGLLIQRYLNPNEKAQGSLADAQRAMRKWQDNNFRPSFILNSKTSWDLYL